jgi:hypothetical protein
MPDWSGVEAIATVIGAMAAVAAVVVPVALVVRAERRQRAEQAAAIELAPRVEALEAEWGDAPDLVEVFQRAMRDVGPDSPADERLSSTTAEWRLNVAPIRGGHRQWAAENRTGADAFNVRAVASDIDRIVQTPDPVPHVPAWSAFSFIDQPTIGEADDRVTIEWLDADGTLRRFATLLR